MEYQQTPPPFTPPPYEYDIPARPKSWLLESILVTILCCMPFGIVGIVYAIRVNSLYDQTDYEEAKRVSDNAKRWTTIGFIIGIIAFLIGVILMFSMGMLREVSMPDTRGLTF